MESKMNKAQDVKVTSMKLAGDVHQRLAIWAAQNVSSLTAELNRSVRERAQREQAEQQVR